MFHTVFLIFFNSFLLVHCLHYHDPDPSASESFRRKHRAISFNYKIKDSTALPKVAKIPSFYYFPNQGKIHRTFINTLRRFVHQGFRRCFQWHWSLLRMVVSSFHVKNQRSNIEYGFTWLLKLNSKCINMSYGNNLKYL